MSAVSPHWLPMPASTAVRQRRVRARAPRQRRVVVPFAAAVAQQATSDAHQKLKGVEVIRCSDGARVDITRLWGPSDRAVIVWARTFGCPFCWELAIQLRRDIKPLLDQQGTKLFLVAIGTLERSKDFVRETGYPADCLLADPEGATYAALGLTHGALQTFFSPQTPLALIKRAAKPGGLSDLAELLPRWKPWQPPQGFSQAMQQGGVFVFEGDRAALAHKDRATGAHANMDEVLRLVSDLAERSEAGARECAASGGAGSE